MSRGPSPESRTGARAARLAVGLAVLAAAALRWRVLDAPLERDEGEYAYFGQLILAGVPPYEGAYNMKLPGIYAVYAAILALFGQTARAVHLGLLVANAATTLLVFLLGRRLFGAVAGAAAAALFALLSLMPAVQGAWANAEHFVLPFALGGWLLLERALARPAGAPRTASALPGLLAAGAVLGLGAVVKQHGALFVAAAALRALAAAGPGRAARALAVALGGAAVYGLTCAAMLAAGVFDAFWLWTHEYARAYAGQVEAAEAWSGFRAIFGPVAATCPPAWLLAAGGLAAVAARGPSRLPALALAAASVAAVLPGFYFRPHYFVLLLPAAALLAGHAAAALGARLPAAWGAAPALVVLCAAWAGVRERDALFRLTPDELTRAVFGDNPFVESVELGALVAELSAPDDRVVVVGSEPQIYFYARRRSATGHVYTYALMEDQPHALAMQRQMIDEIVAADPAVALFVDTPTSWLARADSPTLLLEWFPAWAATLELVASLRFTPRDGWRLVRDRAALARPAPGPSVDVYRRPPR